MFVVVTGRLTGFCISVCSLYISIYTILTSIMNNSLPLWAQYAMHNFKANKQGIQALDSDHANPTMLCLTVQNNTCNIAIGVYSSFVLGSSNSEDMKNCLAKVKAAMQQKLDAPAGERYVALITEPDGGIVVVNGKYSNL